MENGVYCKLSTLKQKLYCMKELNKCILIIDQDKSTHDDFIKALAHHPAHTRDFPAFEIHSAYQGETGLEAVQKAIAQHKPYPLAFVSMYLSAEEYDTSHWNGIETIKHLWEVDPDLHIVLYSDYTNIAWKELLNRVGHTHRLLFLQKPLNINIIQLCARVLTQQWTRNHKTRLKMKNLEKLIHEKTEALELSLTLRKCLEKELIKQSTYDHLTGLPNRTLFIDRVQQSTEQAKRNHLFVAVLFLDLDSFQYVNDSLGHPVGDEILKLFARRLKGALRKSDHVVRLEKEQEQNTASRFGGDEFIIALLMNTENIHTITAIIQRLFRVLTQPYHVADHELTLTFSIGISLYPQDGDNPVTLIKKADMALSRAKKKGKGSFEFFSNEMSEQASTRLELENDLRHALKNIQNTENQELFLEYQPVISLQNNKIISVEALMRWNHPKQGLISPAVFIPIAEASSLIIPLGAFALKTACLQNKAWQKDGFKLSLSVNISGEQFKQNDFIESLQNILEETQLEGHSLELELTESTLFTDVQAVLLKLQTLKGMGVYISLDDFGTGYSSLSYINQFPIDKLKIDQSFIRKLSKNPQSKAIIQAIMLMAKSFHMTVIAEGVETEEQLNILKTLGADAVQGFYFSRPRSVTELSALLRKQ